MTTIRKNEDVLTQSGELANRFLTRFLGLMGKTSLPPDYCLILTPCSSIHMAFMKIPLDIAYLDREGRVIAVQWDLKPWRLGAVHKGAYAVMEAPVGGVLRDIQAGDRIKY